MSKDIAVVDHSARAHSNIVGGSTAKRVMNCTASVLHNQKYPNTESDFAAEGTACHEAVDFILQGKAETDEDVIGLVFNKTTIDDDLYTNAIRAALDYFDELDEEMGGIDFFNEQRVIVPDVPVPVFDAEGNIIGTDTEAAFGTADIVGYSKRLDKTIVLDWKFGVGVAVTAEWNEQMLYYALGAMHTEPTSQFFAYDRPVELFIVQPRSKDGEPFSRWTTSVAQIEAFGVDLRHAVETALGPDAEFKMGEWCKFCPGKAGCPLQRGKAQHVLQMTADQIAANLEEVLDQADHMIELGQAIKSAAHQAMEQGAKFKNWKLVHKRANRSWKDEDAAKKALAKAGLKGKDQLTIPELLSPAQAEAKLKKLGVKELPLGADKTPLTKQESTGTTLAPMTDNRPAVIVHREGLAKLAGRLAGR